MDADLILRGVPFVILALVLLGFALIEALRTRWRDWDGMTASIVFSGIAGALWLAMLGMRLTPMPVEWESQFMDGVGLSLWLTVGGLPSIYRNVALAWQARRAGQFRCRDCTCTCSAGRESP